MLTNGKQGLWKVVDIRGIFGPSLDPVERVNLHWGLSRTR
ncbi:hypothetical protein GLO73106DRAFT_00002020 [Gloeocapsa sp. PCC 73106]|nr:hypothetical protein GLO73106DRAFT_00002020 [Gloeocapsa sp. PCC 73106]